MAAEKKQKKDKNVSSKQVVKEVNGTGIKKSTKNTKNTEIVNTDIVKNDKPVKVIETPVKEEAVEKEKKVEKEEKDTVTSAVNRSTQKAPNHSRPTEKTFNSVASSTELAELIKKHSKEVRVFRTGDVVEGTIVAMDRRYILVDLNAKSEGLISKDELKFIPEDLRGLKIGDKITATVVQPENKQGNLVLTLKKAVNDRNWNELVDLYKSGETIDVQVLDYLKGGLVVDAFGQRGYIPISHLSRQHFEQFNSAMAGASDSDAQHSLGGLKGSMLIVKVIEVDPNKNRLVMSEKEVMSIEEVAFKERRISELQIGDITEGTVSTVLPYGVLVDLKGIDGLIHISEIAWEKVSNPEDYFKAGDSVTVKVIGKDDDKIALSVKELKENPWDKVEEKYPLGKRIKATVSKVVPFGAFIELEPGLDGLIHISETVGPLKVGDEVEAVVVNVDSKERKLALSIRQIEDAKIYR